MNMKKFDIPSHYEFLKNSDDTGRVIIFSPKSGKKYYIEPIYDGKDSADWGSVIPGQNALVNKKGFEKYRGAVRSKESMITEENGFDKIHILEEGASPFSKIDQLEEEYFKTLEKGTK